MSRLLDTCKRSQLCLGLPESEMKPYDSFEQPREKDSWAISILEIVTVARV